MPTAKKLDMGIVIGSPLQQGVLARRHDEEVQRHPHWLSHPRRQQLLDLYALLDESGLSLPEMALRFVLSNADISCALMGARSEEEVELNVAATERGALPEDVLTRLDEINAQVPFRPFEEPACLPLGRSYKGLGNV